MSSGLSLSIPVDEDWGVSTASGDGGHAEVTLADSVGGTEVTLRGPVVQLIDMLETALADLIDYRIRAEGSKLDAKLATLAEHTERAIAMTRKALDLTAGDTAPEPLATADEMVPGGWVRIPGEARWRCVREVALPPTGPAERVILCDGFSWGVAAYDTLPYLTPDEFEAECDRRTDAQAQEDEATDRMQRAEWGNGLLASFTEDGAA